MSEKIYRVQMNSKGMPNFSTAEEIVRCGECKMWMSEHLCQWWSRYGTVETDANDFCSYGCRKEE